MENLKGKQLFALIVSEVLHIILFLLCLAVIIVGEEKILGFVILAFAFAALAANTFQIIKSRPAIKKSSKLQDNPEQESNDISPGVVTGVTGLNRLNRRYH